MIVAVSGGADSVCLLKVLSLLAGEYDLRLAAAHLNHGVRGEEASRDALFVERLCRGMAIPLDSADLDPASVVKGGRSPEEFYREERYSFLKGCLERRGFNKIALGHTSDDLVETVWINLLRGSGVEGLKGFLPCREGIYIRPLFETSRRQILTFLAGHRMDFVEDSTNREKTYLRNRVRHDLIPFIESAFNSGMRESILQLADILRDEDDFMAQVVDALIAGDAIDEDERECRIKRGFLLRQHPAVQKRIIKRLLEKQAPGQRGIHYRHVMDALKLSRSDEPGAGIDIGASIRVSRCYDELIISRVEHPGGRPPAFTQAVNFNYAVDIPDFVHIKEIDVRLRLSLTETRPSAKGTAVFMDCDKLTAPLTVRNIRPGDRIQIYQSGERKKVSDLLIDLKVPRSRRGRIPVLADQDEVLWVAGVRLSEKVRVTAASKRYVKAEIV